MTHKSAKILAFFRGLHFCEWCGKQAQCQACHVFTCGHGGGTRLDVPLNLLSMCMTCHMSQHDGDRPILCDRLAKVAAREGMLQEQVHGQLRRIMAAPKECRLCPLCDGSGLDLTVITTMRIGDRLEDAECRRGRCIPCNGGGILTREGEPYDCA